MSYTYKTRFEAKDNKCAHKHIYNGLKPTGEKRAIIKIILKVLETAWDGTW